MRRWMARTADRLEDEFSARLLVAQAIEGSPRKDEMLWRGVWIMLGAAWRIKTAQALRATLKLLQPGP